MKGKKLAAYVILTIIMVFMLSGCYDAIEPDSLAFVVAIGVDKAKSEKEGYEITIQFANPSQISGGASEEGGKTGKDSINNITVTAPDIYSAVNLANHMVSKTFTLSHTKLIVFSEQIAEAGVNDFMEMVGRSSDIRPNTYFAVSKCDAKTFLNAVDPKTEVNPVRYYTMIFENDYSGFVPANMGMNFFLFSDSEEKSGIMPLCSVAEKVDDTQYSNSGYEYKLGDYEAGKTDVEGEGETQVIGMAVFNKDKIVGEFRGIETEIYNILTNQYKNSYITYYFSKTPDVPVTLSQKQQKAPKIRVETKGDVPQIYIDISIEADYCSSTPKISIEDNQKEFMKEVSDEIKTETETFLKMTQDIGVDSVGFGRYAKKNFKNVQDFSDYKWKEKYKKAEFHVNVDFSIRRTGLMIRSEQQ